jgi:AraC family transcriptional regulator
MKQLSKIPLVRTANGEVLPGNPFSSVVLSSDRTSWRNVVVEQRHFFSAECEENDDDLMYTQHVIMVNLGPPITGEYRKGGNFQRVTKSKGTISLFPSHDPFFRRFRKAENGTADVLYVALDSVFVTRTAADLEVYPDDVELVTQRRSTDPALRHIVMALRAGVQAGGAGDTIYGESLSTALAVHLLREYGARRVEIRQAHRGLSREKLVRAVEYIEDQLHTDLTVSGIARTVHMSPYHFIRLFKQSTGRSPYRYVIEARARKAKELLASGKFSIVEVAHQVGFADQSQLTRHVKNFFALTPKMLLEKR